MQVRKLILTIGITPRYVQFYFCECHFYIVYDMIWVGCLDYCEYKTDWAQTPFLIPCIHYSSQLLFYISYTVLQFVFFVFWVFFFNHPNCIICSFVHLQYNSMVETCTFAILCIITFVSKVDIGMIKEHVLFSIKQI